MPHHYKRNREGGYYINRLWCIENFISRHVFMVEHAKREFKSGCEYYKEIVPMFLFLSVTYNDVVPFTWKTGRTEIGVEPDTEDFKCLIKLSY
jgi:hypothetical protein